MRLLSILFVLTLLPSVAAAEWYDGGTLHKANLATWRSATAANRLATAGDLTASMLKGKDWNGVSELKAYSTDLRICIDEVAVDPALGALEVGEIAAGCAVLLGW